MGMAMRRIFWGFRRNWFLMSPLHYLSGRSDVGFEFAEIFIFEIRLPAITNSRSHPLSVRWYGESPTPRIVESGSRRLPASLICGVSDSPHHRYEESAIEFFKRKLSVSMIRRVVSSPHQWYGESPTPRIVDSESRRLHLSPIRRVDNSPVSLSRGVDDTAYRWYGKSLFEKKISLASIFITLNGQSMP